MKIREQLYQALSPIQRAAAILAAINREDDTEGSRLLSQAPKGEGHGKTFLGMCQALDVYNFFIARSVREILLQIQKMTAAESYCTGWLDAGGAPDDAGYLKRYLEVLGWLEASVFMTEELEAVRKAAREWCENNGVPMEIFSGKLAFLPLVPKTDMEICDSAPVDDAMLERMRSLFREVEILPTPPL